MKIRVYGFRFLKDEMPARMQATDAFAYMEVHAGRQVGKLYRCAAKKLTLKGVKGEEDWWGGIILKIRDAKKFTKLVNKDGKLVFTTSDLAEGERLAEINFFLAHGETGAGIYAHHYQSASLSSFGWLARKNFDEARKWKMDHEPLLKDPDAKAKDKKRLRAGYKGKLTIEQLARQEDFRALVKNLKKVKSFEVSLGTVTTKERWFRNVIKRADSEKITFYFPPDVDVDALSSDIGLALNGVLKDAALEDAKVVGTAPTGKPETVLFGTNALVLAEVDYDDLMADLSLDLSDWAGSISNSPVIAHLHKIVSSRSVHSLLTTT